MNSKFGTALALSTVLLTGTAAAAINTQALVAPTKSSLGTASTTLLPVDQVVSVTPAQAQNIPSQTTNTPAPGQSAGSMPDVTTPTATQPTSASPAITSPKPSHSPNVIYGNPNPSTGGDDIENDNEGQSNNDQGDDGQSNNGQSNDGDDD
jgi:hypothetical protein